MEKMKPILLTFSEKNRDVYDLINNRNMEEFKQNTDYICNAIRFYEKYKNDVNEDIKSIDEDKIEDVVLKILKKHNFDSTDISIEKDDLRNIEDDIDNIDIDIDED